MAIEIFASVSGTVNEFIDWSLAIVSIMILWYIVKFFIVAPPTEADKKMKEKEWAEKGAEGRKWIKEKLNERKEKEEKGKRKDMASPIKDHVLKASKAVSELQNHLISLDVDKARGELSKVSRHVKKAIRRSHELLANVEGKEREAVGNIVNHIHAIQEKMVEGIEIPENIKKGKVKDIMGKLKKLRGSLGDAFNSLEGFHK